jgi:acetyl esterase/lipase
MLKTLIKSFKKELGKTRYFTFFIFSALFVPTAFAQNTFTKIADIPYVADNLIGHKLDLYIPNGATSATPLIIWIHGGGWAAGDKAFDPQNPYQLRYAQNGYAVASINYRVSGTAIFPAQIHDCKAAVRWLRANASQYNLDPTRFGAWGSSAGGHLAALLGTSNDVTDLEGTVGGNLQYSSRVQAVADWFGPTDFLQMDAQTVAQGCGGGSHNGASSPESLFVGCPIQTCPATVQRANPMSYVSPDDPPFFIQHGTVDCTVPTGQSQIFQTLLQSSGNDSSINLVQGAGHGGVPFSAESNLLLVDNFFNLKLKQSVNPLVNSVKVFRKGAELNYFRANSLGSLYRIVITGLNFQNNTKVLINGVQRGVSFTNGNEVTVYGVIGKIPASGEVKIQVKNLSGRFSNVLRAEIRQ